MLYLQSNFGAQLRKLKSANSVQDAIDLLIEIRAQEMGLGKWAFLETLSEIDASHWNKIIKGKATLTRSKLNLLVHRLCVTEEEKYVVLKHIENQLYRKKDIKNKKLNGNNSFRRSKIEKLFSEAGYEFSEFQDYERCLSFIDNEIRRRRYSGGFEEAETMGMAFLLSLKRRYINPPNSVMEKIATEFFPCYSYLLYMQANQVSFKKIIDELESPFWEQWDKGRISALRLHLRRRFYDDFLNLDKAEIYKHQMKAVEALKLSGADEVRFHNVMANKYKIEIEMGLYDNVDQVDLSRRLFLSDRVQYAGEELAMLTSIYAVALMRMEKIDDTKYLLANAITELDTKLGQFSWGRANVREQQGICALTEFELTGNKNFAESAIGYFDDALRLSRILGNTILEDRIFHARTKVLTKSGILID